MYSHIQDFSFTWSSIKAFGQSAFAAIKTDGTLWSWGQADEYKASVLGNGIKRVAIEASHVDWWRKYVGLEGEVIGMTSFGESAPGNDLFEHFGFTKEKVIKTLGL